MSDAVVSALITGGLALAGTMAGAYFSNRRAGALIEYRLKMLEEKVDKHNNVVERTYALEEKAAIHEEKLKVADHRIGDLERQAGRGSPA